MKKRVALVVTVAAFPAIALADVPPPPELAARCTVASACAKGEEAKACQTNERGPARCAQGLAKDGWTFNCKVRNPEGWKEIWCRAKPAAPK